MGSGSNGTSAATVSSCVAGGRMCRALPLAVAKRR